MRVEDHAGTIRIEPWFAKTGEGKADVLWDTANTGGKRVKRHKCIAMTFLIGPDEGRLGTIAAIVPATHGSGNCETGF
jgi:hypothetical protein